MEGTAFANRMPGGWHAVRGVCHARGWSPALMKRKGPNCLSTSQIATYPTYDHRAAIWIGEESCIKPPTFSYLFHPGSPRQAFGKQLAEVVLRTAKSQPGLVQCGAHVPGFISSVSPGRLRRNGSREGGYSWGRSLLHSRPFLPAPGWAEEGPSDKTGFFSRQRKQSKERHLRSLTGQAWAPG